MDKQHKVLCFRGPRSERLPKDMEPLNTALYNAIETSIQKGFDTFLFGACYGFDHIAAQQILQRRRVIKPADPEEIRLIAVIPFEEQAAHWKEEERDTYYDVLQACDEVITLSTHFYAGCHHASNQWMIEHSSCLICYYDHQSRVTGDAVKRATKAGIEVVNLYVTVV